MKQLQIVKRTARFTLGAPDLRSPSDGSSPTEPPAAG